MLLNPRFDVQVTHQNESNQEYLLEYSSGVFATTLMDLFKLCHEQVPLASQHDTATAAAAAAANNSSNNSNSCISGDGVTKDNSITATNKKAASNSSHGAREGGIGGTNKNKKHHVVATEATAPAAMRKKEASTTLQCVSSALITSMKVLVNLTHNSRKVGLGSKMLGALPHTYNITLR